MILLEICAVLVVILLFSILNRLCAIYDMLESIKQLISNPNVVIAESMVDNFISKFVKALNKNSKSKTTKKGAANDQ